VGSKRKERSRFDRFCSSLRERGVAAVWADVDEDEDEDEDENEDADAVELLAEESSLRWC